MSQDITYVYAPITKSDESSRMVIAPISGPNNVDLDGQIVDLEWLRGAVKPWMRFGNVRQAHDSKKPIGKAVSIDMDTSNGVPDVTIHVVDDAAWNLTKHGVLSGVSVGIKNARIIKDQDAPRGRIVGGDLVEISLVDHPSNTNAKVSILKSVGGDDWLDCQTGDLVSDTEKGTPLGPVDGPTAHPKLRHEKHSHDGHEHIHDFIAEDHMHCVTCGEDVATCPHGDSEKSAGFDQFAKSPIESIPPATDLSPAQPSLSGDASVGPGKGGVMVRHQFLLERASDLVKEMASELKGGEHFNPNNKPRAASDVTMDVGATPASAWAWDGTNGNASYGKSADIDSVVEKSFGELFSFLFEGSDLLSKSVEPNSIKAAFIDSVTQVATLVAKQVAMETEARLARIEDMAAPGKGYRNEVVERQLVAKGNGQPIEREAMLNAFGSISEKLNPNEKTAAAASWIAEQLKSIAPH